MSLHAEAPDLRATGAKIVEQELRFTLENPGNVPLEAFADIRADLSGSGCPSLPCDLFDLYVSPIYDPAFRIQTDLSLQPSEAREFRIPIPPEVTTAQKVVRYEDYPFFRANVLVALPEGLIQQDYSNDEIHEMLERD